MRLDRAAEIARQNEPQPFVCLITEQTDEGFTVTTNGREVGRNATISNEFALNGQGAGVGDEVLVITSEANDMPVIVGLSPWMVHS